jgi:type IV secretory pathway TraG/TraD family ATPase VirD4
LVTQEFPNAQSELVCGGYNGKVNIKDFSNGGYYFPFVNACNKYLLQCLLLSCFIYCIIPIWMIISHLQNKKDLTDKILRGVGKIEPEEVKKYIKANPVLFKGYMFKLTDNVLLPESIATRNNLTIGRPGSGKSQLIYRVIEQLQQEKFRCIIHDLKGDMISNFYNEKTDIIFNPVDKRMVRWSLFKELETLFDIQSFCDALVEEGKDPFWSDSSRNLLKSTLILCKYRNQTNYDVLWEYMNTPFEKLKEMFDVTPGCETGSKALSEGKIAASVQAVLATSVQAFEYLNMTGLDRFRIEKENAPEKMHDLEFKGFLRVSENLSYYKYFLKDITGKIITEEYYQYYSMSEMFSIKEWIRSEGKYSNRKKIFLSNQVQVQSAVKSFLGMFVQFATTALCSLPDYSAPKTFFILDEFGQLPRMDGILTLLTQGRSKNGSAWLLIQDVAQIKKIYGNEGAPIIISNCGNLSFFSVSDAETANTLSKSVGSVEIKRTDESRSMSWHDARDSFSQSEKIQETALILPKEIMDLPTLTFVIKMVDIPVTKDRFDYAKYPTVAESFIANDIFTTSKPKELSQPQKVSDEIQPQSATGGGNTLIQQSKNTEIQNKLQDVNAFKQQMYESNNDLEEMEIIPDDIPISPESSSESKIEETKQNPFGFTFKVD